MSAPIQYVADYFTWHEALYLPQWDMMASPTREQERNIAALAARMDKVREILGCPLQVTSWLRPVVDGMGDYNAHIGGAKYSMHKFGSAVDVKPLGRGVEECHRIIAPHLKVLGLRMEEIRKPNGTNRTWLHFDTKTVPYGGQRIFQP